MNRAFKIDFIYSFDINCVLLINLCALQIRSESWEALINDQNIILWQ